MNETGFIRPDNRKNRKVKEVSFLFSGVEEGGLPNPARGNVVVQISTFPQRIRVNRTCYVPAKEGGSPVSSILPNSEGLDHGIDSGGYAENKT